MCEIVRLLEVSDRQWRVGVVKFASSTRTEFFLNRYNNEEDVCEAILRMEQDIDGAATRTERGLLANRNFFTLDRGDRREVRNISILITDGRAQDQDAAVLQGTLTRAADINLMGIVIRPSNQRIDDVRDIVGTPIGTEARDGGYVLQYPDFESLVARGAYQSLFSILCDFIQPEGKVLHKTQS